jgi:hypothetical protein
MSKLILPSNPKLYLPGKPGVHPTAGLPGFPALDKFGPAGMYVALDAGGTVIKLSGHPPAKLAPGNRHGAFGWSTYLETPLGVYFMTHYGTRARAVKLGAHIPAGAILGTIGDFIWASEGETPCHIHIGFHKGKWTP